MSGAENNTFPHLTKQTDLNVVSYDLARLLRRMSFMDTTEPLVAFLAPDVAATNIKTKKENSQIVSTFSETIVLVAPAVAINLPLPPAMNDEESYYRGGANFLLVDGEEARRGVMLPFHQEGNQESTMEGDEQESPAITKFRKKTNQRTDLPLSVQPKGLEVYDLYGKWVKEAVTIARKRRMKHPEFILVTIGTADPESTDAWNDKKSKIQIAPQLNVGVDIMKEAAAAGLKRLKKLHGTELDFSKETESMGSSKKYIKKPSQGHAFSRRHSFHDRLPLTETAVADSFGEKPTAIDKSLPPTAAATKPSSDPALTLCMDNTAALSKHSEKIMHELKHTFKEWQLRSQNPQCDRATSAKAREESLEESSGSSETETITEMRGPRSLESLNGRKKFIRTASVNDLGHKGSSPFLNFLQRRILRASGKSTLAEI
ncbi:hypothetical protein IV203_013303 [Nitzschia inconspicua]|uniref:Uncharacterized protein n=1 Tax=Nitzschia inconspicua TaxID=303405 RepID=A0A9K3M5R9_9STRA|nr:hypothetical protein IV203_013303 [Nitzschia inconspicua]